MDDHCNALELIFRRGKVGNFYNIGSNVNVNNITLIKKLLKLAKVKYKIGSRVKIKYVTDRPGHDLRYAINSDKLKDNLNWKTKIDLRKGLEKTFNWYYENQKYYSGLKREDIVRRLGKNL